MPPRTKPPAGITAASAAGVHEISELPVARLDVAASPAGVRVNRAAAERLYADHRVVHRILVPRVAVEPRPISPEEKLLRAIFGETVGRSSHPGLDDLGIAIPGEKILRGVVVIHSEIVPRKPGDEPKPPSENPHLDRSVDELEMSIRTASSLSNARILTIRDLVQKTEADLLKTNNFGRKSLVEVKQLLAEMGLSLGMRLTE